MYFVQKLILFWGILSGSINTFSTDAGRSGFKPPVHPPAPTKKKASVASLAVQIEGFSLDIPKGSQPGRTTSPRGRFVLIWPESALKGAGSPTRRLR